MNILREDWKPVLNINSIIVGLQYLFLEPNADDPLNKGWCFSLVYIWCSLSHARDPLTEAAEVLRTNRRLFETNVTRSMRGGSINGVYFDVVAK